MLKVKTVTTTTSIAYPLIFAAIFMAAAAQPLEVAPMSPLAPAPSPGLDCFPYLINMSDCLSFVESGSNLSKPEKGCCPELANLVNTQPVCLCQLLGHTDQVGVPVDVSRALKLPSVCSVSTPPVSLCAAFGVPVGALGPSEAPSPSSGIGAPGGVSPRSGIPSDGGSIAATPSPGSTTDGRSASNLASDQHFLIGFAALLLTYFL